MPRSKTPGIPKSQTGGKKVCPLCWKTPDKRDATTNGYHISCAQDVMSMVLDAQHNKSGRIYELMYPDRVQPRPDSIGPQQGGDRDGKELDMTAQSPDQVAAQWAARLAASTDKMAAGAQAVSVAPGVAAARQKAVWAQNTAAAAPKWATNVAAVTREQWQNDYINKGLPRVGTGAQNAVSKMTSFYAKLLPAIATGKGRLPSRGTYDQNKARAAAWMDYMHSLQGQLKG